MKDSEYFSFSEVIACPESTEETKTRTKSVESQFPVDSSSLRSESSESNLQKCDDTSSSQAKQEPIPQPLSVPQKPTAPVAPPATKKGFFGGLFGKSKSNVVSGVRVMLFAHLIYFKALSHFVILYYCPG